MARKKRFSSFSGIKEGYWGTKKKGLFGVKYFYIDKDARVRYGFSLHHLGMTYTLERKGKWGWAEVAWTYISHFNYDIPINRIENLVGYLKWYEKESANNKSNNKCLF